MCEINTKLIVNIAFLLKSYFRSSRSSSRSIAATCAIQVTDHCCLFRHSRSVTIVVSDAQQWSPPFSMTSGAATAASRANVPPLLLVPRCAIDGVVQEAATNLL